MMFKRLALLLIPILALATADVAAAHASGTLQLANEPIGPYQLSLWTSPEPLRAGETLHISLFLLTPPDTGGTEQTYILDAEVTITATPPEGEPLRASTAHTDAEDPFYYEGELGLTVGGTWQVTVDMTGPAGSGSASFAMEVLPAAGGRTWLYVLAAALVVVAVAVWVVARRRGQPSGV